jgi:nitrogen fixation protein FixH
MSFAAPREIRGSHVLMALGGFFGLMLAANAAFIYLAVSTFDGTERNAYQNGLHYNARIEAAKAQEALGWSHNVALGADGAVTLSIVRDGTPVRGLTVEGVIDRPAAQRVSQALVFEPTESGAYRASTSGLESGSWVVTLNARKAAARDGEAAYQLKERLWLKPRQ